jgi:hypothetical protein
MGRHGQKQPPARSELRVQLVEDFAIGGQMLEHVEQTDDVERRSERKAPRVGLHQRTANAPARVPQPVLAELRPDDVAVAAHRFQDSQDVACTAPDLQDAISRLERGDQRRDDRLDHAIARCEPEVAVLGSEERRKFCRLPVCYHAPLDRASSSVPAGVALRRDHRFQLRAPGGTPAPAVNPHPVQ